MDAAILLKLILAHILSDFVLQTNSINEGKRGYRKDRHNKIKPITNTKKYAYQAIHSLTHAVAAYLFISQWSCWIIPLVIFISHFAIDYFKSGYFRHNLTSFAIDQVLHLAVIFAIWLFFPNNLDTLSGWLSENWNSTKLWAIVTAYLLVMKPSSILLNLFICRWEPETSKALNLPNAGKWIGYMERLLIVTFIITNNFEATGFLLAAKSIFRFGDLTKVREVKLTEYVLIGTLSSFTIAIFIGFMLNAFIK